MAPGEAMDAADFPRAIPTLENHRIPRGGRFCAMHPQARSNLPQLVRGTPSVGILVAGQWVSSIGNGMNAIALSWVVLTVTNSRIDLGLVQGVGMLAGMFTLFSGVYVDRWNKRRTMMAADGIRMVVAAALFGLAITGHITVPWLIVLVAIAGLAGTCFSPALFALLPQVVDRADLHAANALQASSRESADLVAPALGGIVMGALGPASLFLINALSFGASITSLGVVRVRSGLTPPGDKKPTVNPWRDFWREFVAGQRPLWGDPFLRRLVPMGMVTGLASVSITVMDVAWVKQVLHGASVDYGVFVFAGAVGAVVGSALSARVLEKMAIARVAIWCLVLWGAFMAALSMVPVLWPDLMIMAGWGVVNGVLSASLTAVILDTVPEEVLGRAVGTLSALTNITSPVGAVVAGIVATVLPLHLVFLAAGLVVAATAVGFRGLPRAMSAGA